MMEPKPVFAMMIAYVDAGSGMLMLQMLAGAVLGGWFYFRRSVVKFISRLLGRNQPVITAAKTAETESTTASTLGRRWGG